MIPTTDIRGGTRKAYHHYSALKTLFLLPLLLLLTACTNSKLIIGPLYNQLDNQMRNEFNKLGDFNEEQKQAFEAAVGTFHVWHRQSEMPQYASLIKELSTAIATPENIKPADVKRWMETAEAHSRSARECYPVNFSFDLMKSLTDKQIDFIERRFKSERAKNRERYASRTRNERIERRLNNIGKWSSRIGVDISASQRSLFRKTLVKQTSLRNEYYELSDQWNKELFALARNQEASDYDARMSAHLAKLWSLLESAYPEQWRKNRELWQSAAFEFIQSMSQEQRSTASSWLSKMGDTVLAISKDTPSFTVVNDESIGCLVEEANS